MTDNDKYVITEEQLHTIGFDIEREIFDEIHSHPLSAELLKDAFKKEIAKWKDEDPLFMAYVYGQESTEKCSKCIFKTQSDRRDAAIRNEAITSDEVADIVDQAVYVARAQERERRLEEFERACRESAAIESRVFRIIESLRKGEP